VTLSEPQKALRKLADASVATASQRFIKTGKGEYGEGDQFIGVRVPTIRAIAKQYRDTTVSNITSILHSPYHEERLLALIMLVYLFEKGNDADRAIIYKTYLANTKFVNGWDLVDSSAHQIVGGYLMNRKRGKLDTLSKSRMLWERRISIIATYHFIKHDQFDDTLRLAEKLLNDKEDLMHKAVGWMLREVGNRDKAAELRFLDNHYKAMPRTMLRYAIEKFDKQQREATKQKFSGTIFHSFPAILTAAQYRLTPSPRLV